MFHVFFALPLEAPYIFEFFAVFSEYLLVFVVLLNRSNHGRVRRIELEVIELLCLQNCGL